MKIIKKILVVSLFLGLMLGITTLVKAYDLVPYIDTDGQYLTYTNTFTNVEMPNAYEQQETYFRGIWVTPKDSSSLGNIKLKNNKTKEEMINGYKDEVIQIFDVMDYYNLNALIFHIRIDNDAIYPSTMNPWSDWFTTYGVDPGWDPLEWTIAECHNRGFEFHAWMNPYRIKASSDKTVAELASIIKNASPNNIGADVSNILGQRNGGAILNPGIPAVRRFIVQTCMEVIRNYDVDAINFDDYFYTDMGADGALTGNNSILTEPDQATYLKYKPANYDANSGPDKANWRREQVDLFIKELHDMMQMYNNSSGRHVQLGIAPSGIWRSGDGIVRYDVAGNALTNGSNTTTTFESYGRYLFADTLKWVNEEWVDYILPQTYYSFTHKTAAFADLLDWWAKVVKNKNVLLYSGMGIYKVSEAVSEAWQKDYKEAPNQILYSTRRKTVQGTVFYSYTALKNAFLGDASSNSGKGMKLIKEEMFINPAILPEIISMTPIKLPGVANLEVIKTESGNKIVFDAVDNAKSYVVYRSDSSMTFGTKQVYKLLGANDIAGKIEYLDANVSDTQYVYGVKVMSRTNTLSDGADFTMLDFSVIFTDESGNTLSTVITPYGNAAVAPLAPTRPGATFVGWSRDISAIKSDLTVSAKYSDSKLTVTFYGIDNKVLKTENVDFHESATAPSNVQEGYTFINWSIPFGDVIYDLDVHANYEINIYKVLFKDYDGTLLAELNVEYLQDAVEPIAPVRTGYTFSGWNQELTAIKDNLTIVALYEADKFTITFINDFDDSIILIKEVGYGEALTYPAPPVVRGYSFNSWTSEDSVVYADMMVHARYSLGEYNVKFVDWNGTVLKEDNITYKEQVIAPINPTRTNHDFIGWDKEFGDVVADIVITAQYAPDTYTVKFFGPNDEVLHTEEVNHNNAALGFTVNVEGYKFVSWDTDYSQVTEDLNIHGNWEKIKGGCNSLNYINGLSMLSLGFVLFILRKRSFI